MLRVMRANIENEPPLVDAASAALQRNTEELAEAVRALYGPSSADSFGELWTQRIEALAAYSEARATGDGEGLARATKQLQAHPAAYGAAVDTMTKGQLPRAWVAQRMSEHVTLLMRSTDAYAAGDFDAAFETERTAYAGMFDQGRGIAAAAVARTSNAVPAGFDDRAARLRSGLGRLLGEHAHWAFEASRAVVASKPATEAAAAALNENTEDILSALGGGPAEEFSGGWAAYVEGLVNFAVAVAESDPEKQSRTRAALDRTPGTFGASLSALSAGKVKASSVSGALKLHNDEILKAVTAYAAFDFAASHELAYAHYNQMYALGVTLADVLEGYTAGRAPRGGAKTGSGGSAAG